MVAFFGRVNNFNMTRTVGCMAVILGFLMVTALNASAAADRILASVTLEAEADYQAAFAADKRVEKSLPPVFHWSEDGRRVVFQEAGDSPSLIVVDVETGRTLHKRPLDAVAKRIAEICSAPFPVSALTRVVTAVSEGSLRIEVCERFMDLDFSSGALTPTPQSEYDAVRVRRPQAIGSSFPKSSFGSYAIMESTAPSGEYFLGVADDDLYLRAAGEEPTVVTEDASTERPWVLESAVWSDAGDQVAILRSDNAGVTTTPLVRWLDGYGSSTPLPAPVVGSPLPKLGLYVVDARTGTLRRVSEEADGYLMIVGFSSGRIIVQRLSRRLNERRLVAIDPESGAETLLVKETTRAFFLPGVHAKGYYPLGTNGFLWVTEDDKHRNIEHRGVDGKLRRRVTKRKLSVADVVHADLETGYVYYTGALSLARPYDRHLWRAPLDGGDEELLTPAPGQHVVQFSPAGNAFVAIHSDIDEPPQVSLRKSDGAVMANLAVSTLTVEDLWGAHPPEPFVVKAADGKTDLHGVLYKPRNFDPAKTYPVIQFVYGGPHTTITQRHFGPGQIAAGGHLLSGYLNTAPALAELGYVTFTVDARGTVGRDRSFMRAAYRGVGERDIADYRAAITALARERSFMDLSRVGVYGRSFGGYMTVRAMLRAPDIYKVGVASAPVRIGADASAPFEVYFGDSEKNRKDYVNADNATHADALEGQLMMILPTLDVDVPFQEAMHLANAFVRAGKNVDMVVIPDQNHMFQYEDSPPYFDLRDDYRNDLIRRYFLEHLRP